MSDHVNEPEKMNADTPQKQWWRAEILSQNTDVASARLWGMGAGGVEVRDKETFFEGDPGFAPVPDGGARLVAFFEIEEGQDGALAKEFEEVAQTSLWRLVSWAHFEDESWKTKWRDFFAPRSLSRRFVVGPPWEEFEAPEGGFRLVVEPGMAFGTGTHETTQLVAQLIDDLVEEQGAPESMLDVGSGSGILSMQASLLGVRSVDGLDLDQESMENARGNLALNDLEEAQITYSMEDLGDWPGEYPLVVANILAHILVSISKDLMSHTAPRGTLILSGILEKQLPQIREAFSAFEEVGVYSKEPWFALVMKR